ncbi:MAG: L-lactate dehydrogenase [Tissierellia bacterium]|nr:L-lactate dehydrogenase [Tissierellia bacterium]
MRLGLVGSGHVGEIVAYTASLLGNADEIIFNDVKKERMESEALDINDGSQFYPNGTKACFGEYKHLANCDIIVVCSGLIPETGDRLDELELNKNAVGDYIEEIVEAGFDGYFIVVTNPCDVITYQVFKKSGFPKNKVIGSGTALDSTRFNVMMAEILGLSPNAIRGMMLGEHGESQFVPWSQIFVDHVPFEEYAKLHPEKLETFDKDEFEAKVRARGWDVYKGKGSTQYGIANTVNAIIRAITHDTKVILNVSTYLDGQYGVEDVFLSTPCVIGKNGIEEVIELELTEEELKRYQESAEIIKKHIELL